MSTNSKFRKDFEKKVRQTIRKYHLFNQKHKVGVAVSGGKDSTVLIFVLKKLGYKVEGIHIDPGIGKYTETNLKNLKSVCDKQEIRLHVIPFEERLGLSLPEMESRLKKKGFDHSSCMICGIFKRYFINTEAKKLGFDFVATGHNLDDEAQSFVMNVFRNDFPLAKRQGPKTGIQSHRGFVQRVKPLCRTLEADIKRYSKLMKFPVNYGICPCSVDAYRREYIDILDDFEKKHPCVKHNIVKFQEQLKAIAPEEKTTIKHCKVCGEPASHSLCRTCTLFKQLGIKREDLPIK